VNQERDIPAHYWIPSQIRIHEDLNPTDGFVYGAIYWYSQMKYERCTASNSTIAKASGCSPTTVGKSLNRLENAGYISRKFDKTGQRKEIVPHITSNKDASNSDEGGSHSEEGVLATEEGGKLERGQNNSNKNNSNKPLKEKNNKKTKISFQKFWKQYPEKQGKFSAGRKWEKLDPETQQAALDDLESRIDRKSGSRKWLINDYIPHGSTYVNQQRWQDEWEEIAVPMDLIEELIDDFADLLNTDPDGSDRQNRKYAEKILNELEPKPPGAKELALEIAKRALQDDYHQTKATNLKYIYENKLSIIGDEQKAKSSVAFS